MDCICMYVCVYMVRYLNIYNKTAIFSYLSMDETASMTPKILLLVLRVMKPVNFSVNLKSRSNFDPIPDCHAEKKSNSFVSFFDN